MLDGDELKLVSLALELRANMVTALIGPSGPAARTIACWLSLSLSSANKNVVFLL